MKPHVRSHLSVVVFAASMVQPAAAIVVNSSFGADGALAYGSGFSSVVQVVMDDVFTCTGAVISSTAILTAKHCTFGFDVSSIDVIFDQSGNGSLDNKFQAASKFEFGADESSLLNSSDLTILTLAQLMPDWATPMDLWDGALLDASVTMVGFGINGVGRTGSGFGVRWAADNVVDAVGTSPFGGPSANIILTDFDDGTAAANTLGRSATPLAREGTTAGGDSGGPLLLSLGDRYAIAGVLSGGTTIDSGFGDISFWTGIAPYRAQFEEFGGRFVGANHVPEPGSLGLALAAMIGLGAAARFRRVSL